MEMAGGSSAEPESQETVKEECSFVWDENTHLYFHARSGFYHDPSAGWYYSSTDGLYYKFENGNYVLLDNNEMNECEDGSGAYQCKEAVPDDSMPAGVPENPPPPSEWLEDTLINLYLSGYNQAANTADGTARTLETDAGDGFDISANVNSHTHKPDSGEENDGVEGQCDLTDPDASRDEENWRAQYGQVVHSMEEPVHDFNLVDLWDWGMVTSSTKDGKRQVARLVGRLVKQSASLHPSMASGGSLLRTAPITEAHLDRVKVRTGQVYKLRSPGAQYLATLSTYDSSNPTKDWGFPELSVHMQHKPLIKPSGKSEPKSAVGGADHKGMSSNQLSTSKKRRSYEYRDRAAERRNFHRGFGVAPGQKSSEVGDVGGSPVSTSTEEESATEVLNISFGAGSYARKILRNMGWKEGTGLGNTTKGLVEPIQAVGNIGNAGLGWPQGRKKQQ